MASIAKKSIRCASARDRGPNSASLKELLDAALADLTAVRAEVAKLVTDLTATRAEVVKINDDVIAVRTGFVTATAQLDADAGVTDTTYASNCDPAAVTAADPAAVTATSPAALTLTA